MFPLGVSTQGGGDTYIPVGPTVETIGGALNEAGYWDSRTNGQIRQLVRQFFFTGKCRWRQEVIDTEARLTEIFDPQVVASVGRNVAKHRVYWRKASQHGCSAAAKGCTAARIRSTRDLTVISYNILSAYNRLEVKLDQFSQITRLLQLLDLQLTRLSSDY